MKLLILSPWITLFICCLYVYCETQESDSVFFMCVCVWWGMDHGMKEWAAKSSAAFLHLSITLSDWFPESHTAIIQWVSIPSLDRGSCCPSSITFRPQHHRFRLMPVVCGGQIFQLKLVSKWDTSRTTKDTIMGLQLLCSLLVSWNTLFSLCYSHHTLHIIYFFKSYFESFRCKLFLFSFHFLNSLASWTAEPLVQLFWQPIQTPKCNYHEMKGRRTANSQIWET